MCDRTQKLFRIRGKFQFYFCVFQKYLRNKNKPFCPHFSFGKLLRYRKVVGGCEFGPSRITKGKINGLVVRVFYICETNCVIMCSETPLALTAYTQYTQGLAQCPVRQDESHISQSRHKCVPHAHTHIHIQTLKSMI